MISRFSFPTNMVFGRGAVRETGELAKKLGARHVLIVTDKVLNRVGLVEPVRDALNSAGISSTVFDGVDPNPVEANVEAGLEVYRSAGCDLIVGLGGGSPLDGAKAIKLRATHGGPFEQDEDTNCGDSLIPDDIPPLPPIPTP